jgi:nitrogen PTS system EIIA component
MKNKKHLTAKEVAQTLGTSMVTVLRWAHQGKIPCKLKGEKFIFKKSEIVDWASSHDLMPVSTNTADDSVEKKKEDFHLAKAIQRGGIIRDLEGSDIISVLENAVNRIPLPEGADRALVLEELINREEIASTGIGKGIAIPHPRRTLNIELKHPEIPMVFLKNPVEFNAVDGEEIFVLFFIFSPNTQIHLKLLSRLSLCIRNREFMALLKARAEETDILSKIEQIERQLDSPGSH